MANNSNKRNGILKRMSNRVRRFGKNMGARLTKRMRTRKNTNRRQNNKSKRRLTNRIPSYGRQNTNRRPNNGSNRKPSNGSNRRPRIVRNHKHNGRNHKHNGRNPRHNHRNRRNMNGGAIEYSPLPCDANGNTHWDSTLQVGHETCVEYGTHGAENDKRFDSDSMKSLSKMKITETIQDVVDQQLKDLMGNLDGESKAAVRQAMQDRATELGGAQGRTDAVQGAMDPEVSRQAYQLALERQAAQAVADAATEQAAA